MFWTSLSRKVLSQPCVQCRHSTGWRDLVQVFEHDGGKRYMLGSSGHLRHSIRQLSVSLWEHEETSQEKVLTANFAYMALHGSSNIR